MLALRAATIAALAVALVAAPLAVGAQQSSKPARLGHPLRGHAGVCLRFRGLRRGPRSRAPRSRPRRGPARGDRVPERAGQVRSVAGSGCPVGRARCRRHRRVDGAGRCGGPGREQDHPDRDGRRLRRPGRQRVGCQPGPPGRQRHRRHASATSLPSACGLLEGRRFPAFDRSPLSTATSPSRSSLSGSAPPRRRPAGLGCWYTPFRFWGRTLDAPDRSGYSSHVKIATITQAKNQLSALIDRVRHGETVLITDRGRPVARLESVVTDPSADPAGRLARLERRGLLRRGGAPPARALRPFARGARASGALDLLLEERRSGR